MLTFEDISVQKVNERFSQELFVFIDFVIKNVQYRYRCYRNFSFLYLSVITISVYIYRQLSIIADNVIVIDLSQNCVLKTLQLFKIYLLSSK